MEIRQPPKKKRRIDKEEETENIIKENVDNFLNERYYETKIHPSKDGAVVFLCRVLKHFLISGDYRLYYNRLKKALENKYKSSSKCVGFIVKIFNAIKNNGYAKFVYLAKGKDRTDSRCFVLKKMDKNALKLMQKFREILKYSAWKYQINNNKIKKNKEKKSEWKWIGDGEIDEEYEENEGKIFYKSVIYGDNIFNINDIIELKHERDSIQMRPWIGRIIKMYDNHNGTEKKFQLRWFWFWNQILEYCQNHRDKRQLNKNIKKQLSNSFPPKASDIFEGNLNEDIGDEPISLIKHKIYLVSDYNKKHKNMINGINVFNANYFISLKGNKLIKKKKKYTIQDEKRLENEYKSDDDDVVQGIEKQNNDNPPQFTDLNKNNKLPPSVADPPSVHQHSDLSESDDDDDDDIVEDSTLEEDSV